MIALHASCAQDLTDSMRAKGFSEELVQWLASSLVPMPKGSSDGMTWVFDIAGARLQAASCLERDQMLTLRTGARAVILTLTQTLSRTSELHLTPSTDQAFDPAICHPDRAWDLHHRRQHPVLCRRSA